VCSKYIWSSQLGLSLGYSRKTCPHMSVFLSSSESGGYDFANVTPQPMIFLKLSLDVSAEIKIWYLKLHSSSYYWIHTSCKSRFSKCQSPLIYNWIQFYSTETLCKTFLRHNYLLGKSLKTIRPNPKSVWGWKTSNTFFRERYNWTNSRKQSSQCFNVFEAKFIWVFGSTNRHFSGLKVKTRRWRLLNTLII